MGGHARWLECLSALFAVVAAGACSLTTSLDGFANPPDTDLSPGMDGAVEAAADADAAVGPDVLDAATDRRSVPPCTPGGRAWPVEAFDMTPAPVAQIGPTCDLGNVLDEDGRVAGLDRNSDPDISGELAGVFINSCVGVAFDTNVSVTALVIRMQPTASACGFPCGGSACGTGDDVQIFAGPSGAALTYIKFQKLGTAMADYTVPIPAGVDARVGVVCRNSNGSQRDDVAVDVITGICK